MCVAHQEDGISGILKHGDLTISGLFGIKRPIVDLSTV
jgi:hypothetical protein